MDLYTWCRDLVISLKQKLMMLPFKIQNAANAYIPPQVTAVMEAMPSSNLRPENEDAVIEKNRLYRTTYMFRQVGIMF
jgi:fibronectin type 3 domain-containing protein